MQPTDGVTATEDRMGNHDFDDGLVHSHQWAREPFTRTPRRHVEPERAPDDCYDDGLVHDHGWARTSTGH